jgi:hypothetical protein
MLNGKTMTTTVNVNQSKTMRTLVYVFIFTAIALATSFARGEDRPARAAILGNVQVKEVSGAVEYTCDSTGWHTLSVGKILSAGASIRTGERSSVIIAMEQEGSLVRVGPMRKLELAAALPDETAAISVAPGAARVQKVAAVTAEFASK